MSWKRSLFGPGAGLILAGGQLLAADIPPTPVPPPSPYCPTPVPSQPARPYPQPGVAPPGTTPPGVTPPGEAPPAGAPTEPPGAVQPDMLEVEAVPPISLETAENAFAQAGEAGTEATPNFTLNFTPNMLGDLPATQICGPIIATLPGGSRAILTPGTVPALPAGSTLNVDLFVRSAQGVPTTIPAGQPIPPGTVITQPVPGTRPCPVLPVVVRGAFKIAENESPRPVDRVFGTYDNFYNLNSGLRMPGVQRTGLDREVTGFEKTFLGGNASFGMRLPFLQVNGDPLISQSGIGDLTMIFKYALINNLRTGNVLSGGMVVTAPTGSNFLPLGVPDVRPTYLQPWVGGIYTMGNWFVQGFSSVNVPTDSRDVVYLFNDYGLSYYLYRSNDTSKFLTGVVPTFEVHVNTPTNHRGSATYPIPGIDIVDLTTGTTFRFGRGTYLGLGGVVPVTGPKPWDFQFLAQLNYRF